jgi:phenylalanyl-tRNA synthetase alpha chain
VADGLQDDVLLAPVGLVYRRDVIDRLHVGKPHQLALWRIRRGQSGDADLDQMIELVTAVTSRAHRIKPPPRSTVHSAWARNQRPGRWTFS